MKERVLLFHFEDKSITNKMQIALALLKIPAKKITMAEYNQTIGYLAGAEECDKLEGTYEGEELSAPMMLMAMSGPRVDQVLAAFRKQGVPMIPYKAVLTEFNKAWTPSKLFDELVKEHEAIRNQ